MPFAIKAAISEPSSDELTFAAQKTMYGGKLIREGDAVFVFASENKKGRGLIARAIVTSASPVAKKRGIARQTPRITMSIRIVGRTERQLGRNELKHYDDWDDGRAETELNFKLYRQATDKVIGISGRAASFLDTFF